MPALLKARKRRGKKKAAVLNIRIIKRKDSRFWQAKISAPGFKLQRTTRTLFESSAKEFAELAYRHFTRTTRSGGG